MAIKIYSKEFEKMLGSIFASKQQFFDTFGGALQTASDAEYNGDFLTVKVSPTNVVVNKYDTGENVAFGTGTGSSSRFGKRVEIKSIDKTVAYEDPIAIHEGIDKFTVNDISEQIVAERAALHAKEWTEYLNKYMAGILEKDAKVTKQVTLTEDAIIKLFAEARKHFVNKKVSNALKWTAYVNADVYNLLLDSKLTTTAKNSSANIDNQDLIKFKGFVLRELAEDYFNKNTIGFFVPDNVGIVGLGLETYRVIDASDFSGVAIQAAGKLANYVPDENKEVIIKATVGA